MKTLNLNALLTAGHIVENNGVRHPVRPLTPRIAYLIDAASSASDPLEKMRAFGDAIAALVPSMPRDEVDDLTTAQTMAIIGLASTEVDAVSEAVADPNGSSPTTSASPGTDALTS